MSTEGIGNIDAIFVEEFSPLPSVLDLYKATSKVIGQDKARKQLAVLIKRQLDVAQGKWPRSESAIISGWTGSGKTYLTRMMCEACGLPFADANATQYTESGYAGEDLSQMFVPLIEAAAKLWDEQHNQPSAAVASVLEREDIGEITGFASTGVLLLDEFDKWMHRQNHTTGRLDTAIQSELLKMVEGSIVYVSGQDDTLGIPFDTSKVLILCAGAFVGLTGQVLRRLDRSQDFVKDEGFWNLIEQMDFVRYGVIPELAGRLSKMVFLRPLQKEDLARIMFLPGGPIEELRTRFAEVDCEWEIPDIAIVSLADVALRREVGARGVDSVLWNTFNQALYKASTSEVPTKVVLGVNQLQAQIFPRE